MRVQRSLAVVMGDLVGSERGKSAEHLHRRFNEAVDRQNRAHAAIFRSPLTITLGDEFQGLLSSLVTAAQVAREVRLDLLDDAIDCRFAIGIVRLDTPLNAERAWNMMGAGLAETRARLNEKRKDTLYRFVFPGQPVLQSLLEAGGAGLTAIERAWTDTQRRDIRLLLQGKTPVEVARLRNVSVHTIYKVRASGAIDLYLTHWMAIQDALAELDRREGLEAGAR